MEHQVHLLNLTDEEERMLYDETAKELEIRYKLEIVLIQGPIKTQNEK